MTPKQKPDDGEADNISAENLLLDIENPRLTASLADAKRLSQAELLEQLWTEWSVDEVAISIAENGYFPHEPLLVVPAGKDKYTVVEGNRRLAAVKILLDDQIRAKLKVGDIPELTPARRKALQALPVRIYEDKEQIWPYVGFRHIHGVKPWDAFSKAQYAVEIHEEYGVPLEEIARKIGDRFSTLERFYRGYVVLKQAEEQVGFSRRDIYKGRFSFSHLYTALSGAEYRKFLGLEKWGDPEQANPVPKNRLKNLREFMTWLYGSKAEGKAPVVSKQNPDLWQLAQTISTRRGLDAVRSGYSLSQAVDIAEGDERRFRQALLAAKEHLQVAKGVSMGYQGDIELLETITSIVAITDSLKSEMTEKRRKK